MDGGIDKRRDGEEELTDKDEWPSWTCMEIHRQEQLVWQQDDCHRCLPTVDAVVPRSVHLSLRSAMKSLPGRLLWPLERDDGHSQTLKHQTVPAESLITSAPAGGVMGKGLAGAFGKFVLAHTL